MTEQKLDVVGAQVDSADISCLATVAPVPPDFG
jgi:hypothetical protein